MDFVVLRERRFEVLKLRELDTNQGDNELLVDQILRSVWLVCPAVVQPFGLPRDVEAFVVGAFDASQGQT